MKFLLLVFITLFSSTCFSGANDWYFDRAINSVEFWKNPSEKGCRIVVDKQEEASNKPIEYYKTPLFQKELQAKKKEALSMFGVDQWTVKFENVSKIKDEIVVDFSGDYLDNSKEKTAYRERHIYGPEKYTQFLYTCPDNVSSSDMGLVFDQIRKAKQGVRQ